MKGFSFLISTILLFSLLSACASDERAPNATSDVNVVETIVAGTLSAIPSPSLMPTETLTPTQTVTLTGQWLTWPPYIQKEKAQYLFQLEFDTNQWELKNDPTQNVYGLKRFEQYLLNKQISECAIIQTVGLGLSSEYLLEDGQKDIDGNIFNTKSVKRNGELVFVIYSTSLYLDNSYNNIFVVGGSGDCLASGELVLSAITVVNVENIVPIPANTPVQTLAPLYSEVTWENLGPSEQEVLVNQQTNERITLSGNTFQAPLPSEKNDLVNNVHMYYSNENMANMGWMFVSGWGGATDILTEFYNETGYFLTIRFKSGQSPSIIVWISDGTTIVPVMPTTQN